MEMLQERVDQNKKGINPSVVLIFPEGCTTNGKAIIRFNKGVFMTKIPIRVTGIFYDSEIDPSFNMINLTHALLGTMFSL